MRVELLRIYRRCFEVVASSDFGHHGYCVAMIFVAVLYFLSLELSF